MRYKVNLQGGSRYEVSSMFGFTSEHFLDAKGSFGLSQSWYQNGELMYHSRCYVKINSQVFFVDTNALPIAEPFDMAIMYGYFYEIVGD